MKKMTIIKDLTNMKPFAVIVHGAGKVSAYGASPRGEQWANFISAENISIDDIFSTLSPALVMETPEAFTAKKVTEISDAIDNSLLEKLNALLNESKSLVLESQTLDYEEKQYPCVTDSLLSSFANKQLALDYKANAFAIDSLMSANALRLKSVRAFFDPNLPPSGGYRCPRGTINGGQITDRFGRGCGGGVTRRLGRALENTGRALGDVGETRDKRKLARRTARAKYRAERARINQQYQGPIGRAFDRAADRVVSGGRSARRGGSKRTAKRTVTSPNVPTSKKPKTRKGKPNKRVVLKPKPGDARKRKGKAPKDKQPRGRAGDFFDRLADRVLTGEKQPKRTRTGSKPKDKKPKGRAGAFFDRLADRVLTGQRQDRRDDGSKKPKPTPDSATPTPSPTTPGRPRRPTPPRARKRKAALGKNNLKPIPAGRRINGPRFDYSKLTPNQKRDLKVEGTKRLRELEDTWRKRLGLNPGDGLDQKDIEDYIDQRLKAGRPAAFIGVLNADLNDLRALNEAEQKDDWSLVNNVGPTRRTAILNDAKITKKPGTGQKKPSRQPKPAPQPTPAPTPTPTPQAPTPTPQPAPAPQPAPRPRPQAPKPTPAPTPQPAPTPTPTPQAPTPTPTPQAPTPTPQAPTPTPTPQAPTPTPQAPTPTPTPQAPTPAPKPAPAPRPRPQAPTPTPTPTPQAPTPTPTPAPKTNSAQMPSYDDIMKMTPIAGPTGSQGGQWYRDSKTGKEYLLKPTQSTARANNEVAVASIYRASGMTTPNIGLTQDAAGNNYIISEKIDIRRVPNTAAAKTEAKKGMGIDMLASNWDAWGSGGANSGIMADGTVVRIDYGGGGFFRAQGAPKPSFADDQDWIEVHSMLTSAMGRDMYGDDVTNKEIIDAMQKVVDLDLKKVDQDMKDFGVDDKTRQDMIKVLDARQKTAKQIVDQFSKFEPNSKVQLDSGNGVITNGKLLPGGKLINPDDKDAPDFYPSFPNNPDGKNIAGATAIPKPRKTPSGGSANVKAIEDMTDAEFESTLPDLAKVKTRPAEKVDPPSVNGKPVKPSQLPKSQASTLPKNYASRIKSNVGFFQQQLNASATDADLDAVEAEIRKYIKSLISSRDSALARYLSLTDRGDKTRAGREYQVFASTIAGLQAKYLGPGGDIERRENAIKNGVRLELTNERRLKIAVKSMKEKLNTPLSPDELKPTGTKRSVKEISDTVDANYADGHVALPGAVKGELDTGGINLFGLLTETKEDYQQGRKKSVALQFVRAPYAFIDTDGVYHGDELFYRYLDATGFSRKPVQVTEEEIRDLNTAGWLIVHRGTSTANVPQRSGPPRQRSAQENAQDFIDGTYFAAGEDGKRYFGAGTYAAGSPMANFYGYDSSAKGGVVMAISPNARIISNDAITAIKVGFDFDYRNIDTAVLNDPNISKAELLKLARNNPLSHIYANLYLTSRDSTDPAEKTMAKQAMAHFRQERDTGWIAMALGYDVMYSVGSQDVYTIMNRSAVVVLDRPVTYSETTGFPMTRGVPPQLINKVPDIP